MKKASPIAPEPSQRLCLAMTTTDTREKAEAIAEKLVAQKIVACAQIDGPTVSLFNWEGKVEKAEEYRLTLKLLKDRLNDAEVMVKSIHSYDVPEWLVLEASAMSSEYLNWVINSTYGSH